MSTHGFIRDSFRWGWFWHKFYQIKCSDSFSNSSMSLELWVFSFCLFPVFWCLALTEFSQNLTGNFSDSIFCQNLTYIFSDNFYCQNLTGFSSARVFSFNLLWKFMIGLESNNSQLLLQENLQFFFSTWFISSSRAIRLLKFLSQNCKCTCFVVFLFSFLFKNYQQSFQ